MPSGTEVQQLIDDLRDRKSRVCRAFDELFGKPEMGNKHIGEWKPNGKLAPERPNLQVDPPFWTAPPPEWAVDELMGPAGPNGKASKVVTKHLTQDDIDHITNWPPDQMELIRAAVNEAINTPNRFVEFFWDFWGEAVSGIRIEDNPGKDVINITFLTPRSNLMNSKGATAAKGDVEITVP